MDVFKFNPEQQTLWPKKMSVSQVNINLSTVNSAITVEVQ